VHTAVRARVAAFCVGRGGASEGLEENACVCEAHLFKKTAPDKEIFCVVFSLCEIDVGCVRARKGQLDQAPRALHGGAEGRCLCALPATGPSSVVTGVG
jgi:hypothetical protein